MDTIIVLVGDDDFAPLTELHKLCSNGYFTGDYFEQSGDKSGSNMRDGGRARMEKGGWRVKLREHLTHTEKEGGRQSAGLSPALFLISESAIFVYRTRK